MWLAKLFVTLAGCLELYALRQSLRVRTGARSPVADVARVRLSQRLGFPRSSSELHCATTTGQLFCNTELNMNKIEAVGFDMDFTLAQYLPEFDQLGYCGAKRKLVEWLGYPEKVNSFVFDASISRRGCMIDKKRGNILKLDQHRYVRAVEHGLTPLSREQRKSVYRASYQETETFTGKEFSNVDTPFSLVEACLFAQLVDLKDQTAKQYQYGRKVISGSGLGYEADQAVTRSQPGAFFNSKSYTDLWVDLRRCVDRCHTDGAIKSTVAQDPAKYIVHDEQLFPTLRSLRQAGKKVFLLTNSLFDYTQVVMNYLEGRKARPEERDFAWMDYFDLIIVGGNKPAFLLDDSGALSLYRVDPRTGTLSNCVDLPKTPADAPAFLKRHGKAFQGGNAHILHTLLQAPCGENLLYVGDHIFADVLRSKRTLGWRTCLIVPELEREVAVYQSTVAEREELMRLRRKQFALEKELDELYVRQQESQVGVGMNAGNKDDDIETEWKRREEELKQLRAEIRKKFAEYDAAFHPRWGQLFKAGFQESRFSKQLRDYACMYTSKVSNLASVSPCRPVRPMGDTMPHEYCFVK